MPPAPPQSPGSRRFQVWLLVAYGVVWLAAAIGPRDRPTWALENLGVVLLVAGLVFTRRWFEFSNRSYALIAAFLALHAVGAHTGYAHSPVGEWMKSVFHTDRNYFDRVVHCAFGLLLVEPIREVLQRTARLGRRASGWYAVVFVLAASSFFEVVEAVVAESVSPGTGPDWLGAQGDEWDAQLDMLVAWLGALAVTGATLIFERKGRVPSAPLVHAARPRPFRERRGLQVECAIVAVAWALAAIAPVSRSDWMLENLLVALAVPVLIVTYRRRPLSEFSYSLITVFFVLHLIGAHYTYAEVPAGFWMRDALHLSRNHFDRVVHFAWGLLLTVPLSELLRTRALAPTWVAVLPAAVVAASSGAYEILEAVATWFVAPELGQAYLGTQGDVWDGQKDMACAMGGAAIAVIAIVRRERARRRAPRTTRSTPRSAPVGTHARGAAHPG